MADEREIVIRIRGQLSREGFDAATVSLRGLREEVEKTSSRGRAYEEAVKKAGGSTRVFAADATLLNREFQRSDDVIKNVRQRLLDSDAAMVKTKSSAGLLDTTIRGLTAAFTVTAIANFGRQILNTAGHLVDLRTKTGASLEWLQRVSFVADQAGTDIGVFTDAMFKGQVNIAKGSDAVKAALRDLGLQQAQLQAMRPEDQFDTVARALAGVENQNDLARIATTLYGQRVGEILPGIIDRYEELKNSATVASDAQIEAVDRAADALDRMYSRFETRTTQFLANIALAVESVGRDRTGVAAGDLVAAIFGGPAALTNFIQQYGLAGDIAAIGDAARQRAGFGRNINIPAGGGGGSTDLTAVLAQARQELRNLTSEMRANITAGLELGQSTKDIAESVGVSEDAVRLFSRGLKEQRDATNESARESKKLADELQRLRDQITGAGVRDEIAQLTEVVQSLTFEEQDQLVTNEALMRQLDGYAQKGHTLSDVLRELLNRHRELRGEFRFVEADIARVVGQLTYAADIASRGHALLPPGMVSVGGVPRGPLPSGVDLSTVFGPGAVPSVWRSLGGGLRSAFTGDGPESFGAQLGPTIIQALTGGGSVGSSIGALAGNQLGTELSDALGGVLRKSLGGTVGGAIASMLPGLGTLIVPLIDAIADAFKNETLEARDDFARQLGFEGRRENGDGWLQGWEQRPVDQLFEHLRDVLDPEVAEGLINRAVGLIGKHDEAANQEWMDDVRAALRAVEEEAEATTRELQERFVDLQGTLARFGGSAPTSLRPMIDELLRSRNLTAEMREQLQAMTRDPSWEAMEAIAREYGIAQGALGARFMQQKLNAQAVQYATDFGFLVDEGGGDARGVLEGMTDEVSELVRQALAGDHSLPENIRRMVELMAEWGLLLDEEGNQLRDISELEFTEKIEDPIDRAADYLEEIRDLLRRQLEQQGVEIESGVTEESIARKLALSQKAGSSTTIPEFASGGIVTRPTLALIGEAGPEAVVPLGGGAFNPDAIGAAVAKHLVALAGSRSSTTAGGITVNFYSMFLDRDGMARAARGEFGQVFAQALRESGALRAQILDGLGL